MADDEINLDERLGQLSKLDRNNQTTVQLARAKIISLERAQRLLEQQQLEKARVSPEELKKAQELEEQGQKSDLQKVDASKIRRDRNQ
jgi:hypothetical protein